MAANSTAQTAAKYLSGHVRGDVFTDVLHRAAFSRDSSIYQIIPLCVVAPLDAADVIVAVKYAAEKSIHVAARGAGSGLAGESLSSGIVFDMTRYMNKIIGVSNNGELVICQPGVVLDDLNNYLSGYNRKIGPDPSSSNRATIGGIVANNSTGAHSLQYGHIADYLESVEAVLADGSLLELKNDSDPAGIKDKKTASIAKQCMSELCGKEDMIAGALPKTKRNRCGYNIAGVCHDGRIDMAKLMAGSEGTLAIFTKITLRTVPLPPVKALLQLEFDSLDKMAKAVPVIVDSGAATCDVMDKNVINMAIESLPEYRDILPAGAELVLLIEHTGSSQREVQEKIDKTGASVGALASGRTVFFEPKQQKRVWKSRKDAVPLLFRAKGKKHPVEFVEDVSVDNTKLAEYIVGLKKIGKRHDVSFSYYGHAGDGELHIRPNLDLSDKGDLDKMRSIADEVFELAWSLGGSISGEHADGLLRAAFVRRQYGDQFYDLLCRIKEIFDPKGLMNPGKIINPDPDIMTKNLRVEHGILPERLKSNLLFEKDELSFELEKCSGCGVCLSRELDLRLCPVFRALREELGSPRAKANLLYMWASGNISDDDFQSPQFRKFLDLCINCKACSLQCPSGVDVSKLMIAARTEYAKRKGLRVGDFALSHSRYMSMMGNIFSPIANFVTSRSLPKWLMEIFAGFDRRMGLPIFESGTFLSKARKYLLQVPPVKSPVDRVAYFVDTYVNYNGHHIGFAVLTVLRNNSIEVILPEQRPVPLPAVVYGNIARAKKDLSYSVKYMAEAVRKGYKIVCSEPSAVMCLRDELRHFVSGEDAGLVSENTFELMSYLLGLYQQGKLRPIEKKSEDSFIYHCPCHLLAAGGCGATIELLKNLAGIAVADLKAGCCGLAGTFGMQQKNYDLSMEISKNLVQALAVSSAKEVLTECSACGMQIEHISGKTARHPIEILAELYAPLAGLL